MRKIFNPSKGENIIYIEAYEVKESTVVENPIDEKERPLFRIGRVDLANGGYLINGTQVYDTVEEAEGVALRMVENEISKLDSKISFYEGMKIIMEKRKENLLNKIKDEEVN